MIQKKYYEVKKMLRKKKDIESYLSQIWTKFKLNQNLLFFEFLLNSTLIMNLCEILYNVASAALA